MALTDAHSLALLERGASRHPLDRALLLAAQAEPEIAWADRPLGARDACLIGLRCRWFGAGFDAVVACSACSELLSLQVDLRALVSDAAAVDAVSVLVDGVRFRAPTTRDLAALARDANGSDIDGAAELLLQRLALDPVPDGWGRDELAAVERALDAADPLAHVTLDVACEHCGQREPRAIDIAACLWDDVAAQAERALDDVHLLAGAYGWSESEILAMPPARRALYRSRVCA